MSGVYPYCVVPAGTAPPTSVVGLSGHPVQAHDVGPFEVWISRMEAEPRLDLSGVRRHHEVVVAAMALTTPVPVRFGAWAPSLSVLEERTLARRAEIEAAQEQVRGRVEFGVRVEDVATGPVTPDAPDPHMSDGSDASGRAYLHELSRAHDARRQRRAARTEIARRLRSHLGDLPCDEKVRLLEPPGLFAAAHLVGRDAEALYRRGVEGFIREVPTSCEVHVTGPWPPYSFAS